MYSNYGEKMKHLFLTSVIVSLFIFGCSQKKETAETKGITTKIDAYQPAINLILTN